MLRSPGGQADMLRNKYGMSKKFLIHRGGGRTMKRGPRLEHEPYLEAVHHSA